MDAGLQEILIFNIEDQRFAIPLINVEYVIRAQAITKLKDAPGYIEGIIDYYGALIAVLNLRSRLGIAEKELELNDRFIIVKTPGRKLVIIADRVEGVMLPNAEDLDCSKEIDGGMRFMHVLRDKQGIILIYDLENVISSSEEFELKKIIAAQFSQKEVI